MTLSRYRKVILYTIVALLGIAALVPLGLMTLFSGCRGQGCYWLLLIAMIWALAALPAIAALLLAGFAVCSSYRFRDIGLSGLLGVVPAFLLPRAINLLDAVMDSPTIVFMPAFFALSVISIVCLGICLWLLFFKNGSYLTESRRANALIYKVTFWSCVAFAIVGIPSTIVSFARLFEQSLLPPEVTSFLAFLTFGISPIVYYLFAVSSLAIAAGLLALVVRRPRTDTGTELPLL